MEYRYERKYLIEGLQSDNVNAIIKHQPGFFVEAYPFRYVNNIYFDNSELESFNDNVIGHYHRRKYRIRWYGDLEGHVENPVLEIKEKKGLLGTKFSFPLPSFTFDGNCDILRNPPYKKEIKLPPKVAEIMTSLNPTLINRYGRHYYESSSQFRVTVDKQLQFINPVQYSCVRNLDQVTIVELKYEQSRDQIADEISTRFPFQVTKSSKYTMGMDLTQ